MGDPFRKVRPGEDVTFSAAAWNAMLEAARAALADQLSRESGPRTTTRSGDLVRVKNETGVDLPRRSVVGLSDPVFTPLQSEDAFLREVTFRGVVPTGDSAGRFAILLEPAPAGRVVRAWVAGVTQVRVNMSDPDHACAEAAPGDTNALASAEDGSAQILWVEGDGEGGYYGGEQWGVVRFGSTCGGSDSGGGQAGRCECPEDSYEVEVECGDCGSPYGPAPIMPRFWWVEVLDSSDNYYSEAYCDGTPCEDLLVQKIRIENETEDSPYYYDGPQPTCTWSGKNARCLRAELTIEGDTWKLTILDRNDCVLAVLRKAKDDFACCGVNLGWELDPDSACDVDVKLYPDPCTCCPAVDCPPDGKPICDDSDCCVTDCTINVTVDNLATVPAIPPATTPPPEACGGMNGSYSLDWTQPCTWYYKGVPAGGSTEVEAVLTLSGETWTLRLEGEDDQVAVFRGDGCGPEVSPAFVQSESSCPATTPAPSASFTLGGT